MTSSIAESSVTDGSPIPALKIPAKECFYTGKVTRRDRIVGVLIWVVGLPLIWLVFARFARSHPRALDTGLRGLPLEAAVFALLYLVLLVHELGHAIAARLVGFQVLTIAVGPVFVMRGPSGPWRLRGRRNFVGGFVCAAPKTWPGELAFRRRFLGLVLGGPIVSVGLGAAIMASTTFAHPMSNATVHVFAFMNLWALLSVAVGALTLVPLRMRGGQTSDGEKLLRLSMPGRFDRDRPASSVSLMGLRLGLMSQQPRDYDPALLTRAQQMVDEKAVGSIDAAIFLYHHYVDSEQLGRAREALQAAIDRACGSVPWPRVAIMWELTLEAALFEGVWRNDRQTALAWVNTIPDQPQQCRELAALLSGLLGDDKERARAALDRFEVRIKNSPLPAAGFIRRKTLDRLRQGWQS